MIQVDLFYINMSPTIDNIEKRSIEKSNHLNEILSNRTLYNKEKSK